MVEVTQADRLALQAYLVERARLAFTGDTGPHAELLLDTLAAHREAAYEAGMKAGAEAERARVVALVKRIMFAPDDNVDRALDDLICCNGHMCGCRGSSVREYLIYQFTSAIERGEHLETSHDQD